MCWLPYFSHFTYQHCVNPTFMCPLVVFSLARQTGPWYLAKFPWNPCTKGKFHFLHNFKVQGISNEQNENYNWTTKMELDTGVFQRPG